MNEENPFFASEWTTPFGAPPFEQIREEHYVPAFDEGMRRHMAEIEAIAASDEPPTFANTLEALERSGAFLARVAHVFFELAATDSTEGLVAIQQEYAPKLSQHMDTIQMNDALFARIKALYEQKASLGLNAEQDKLLVDRYKTLVRAGAFLEPAAKERLKAINARLAELYTRFGDSIRKENAEYALIISNEADLAGLPPEVVAVAAGAAEQRGQPGKWAFTLVRSSVNPFLQNADNRELRRQIYQAYISRGAGGNERDTRGFIKEIVALRAERAGLLGFPTHAHYMIDRNMAKTPEAVRELLNQLWPAALAKAKLELAALEKLVVEHLGPGNKLEPWDWRYYAERARKARYDLSEEELKPYFEVNAVRQGAFDVASRLFKISFHKITKQVPTYHPEVKAFELKDASGAHVGLLYVDYHPRPSKRGGAWMQEFRTQTNLDGRVRPIVVNVGNFPPPVAGKPALLGWDEVQTLFHELGHALHGLLSNVTYESQAGTSVKRDFVELPSQIMENWASEPSVMKKYARHYETGEPIPDALIAKLREASTFNQGFAVTEVTAAALLDLAWHTMPRARLAEIESVEDFDRETMQKIGLIPQIAPRYHSPYFQHIFAGDSYSAGYYVYQWAEVYSADAFAAFEETGDPFNPALAERLYRQIFASGGSRDEMESYEAFRGRPPTIDALLDARGLRSH